MADISKIMAALGGFGAGYQGQGAQYLEGIRQDKLLGQQEQDRAQMLDDKRKAAMVQDAWTVNKLLDDNKIPVALKLLDNRIEHIQKLKGDPSDTMAIKEALVSGDPARVAQAKQELQVFAQAGIAAGAWAPPVRPEDTWEGKKFAAEQGIREGDLKLRQRAQDWKEQNPNAGVAGDASTAHAKDLAIYEKMVKDGNPNAERFAYMVGLSGRDIQSKVDLAGRETTAKETSKADVERNTLAKQNANAYETYRVGLEGLTSGLEGTTTGAIAGRVPAVTAAQQTAEGAVAAMAPILKATFRQSGEGTFTDSDQKLLMSMIPTRTDLPDARAAKIANINKIVESKLLAGQQKQQAKTNTPKTGGVLHVDAAGNKAMVYPDGSYEEVN